MELKDKIAIITGAAGAVGRTVAELFANEGANLVLVEPGLIAKIKGMDNFMMAALVFF